MQRKLRESCLAINAVTSMDDAIDLSKKCVNTCFSQCISAFLTNTAAQVRSARCFVCFYCDTQCCQIY